MKSSSPLRRAENTDIPAIEELLVADKLPVAGVRELSPCSLLKAVTSAPVSPPPGTIRKP